MAGSLLLDTNLAVLLFVGFGSRSSIRKHKRLQNFEEEDFDLLRRTVDSFDVLLLSPNVLSETSNLIRYMLDPARTRQAVDAMTRTILAYPEVYVPSSRAIGRPEYHRLGMTDSVLLEMLDDGATLLTDDLALYIAGSQVGKNVINFNHLRERRRLGFRWPHVSPCPSASPVPRSRS